MAENTELCKSTKQSSWIWGWFNWTSSSVAMLRAAEKKILSCLKNPYRGWYVDIGPVVGTTSDKIWTISSNADSQKTPLVLLHGLGAGVGLWVLNFDAFSSNRPVYAIDILGFGRSSRPYFDKDALKAEKQLVNSVEEWRREMNLNEIILLGHSMGGFLAASYAISYPNRVKHLILADPWGFPEKPEDSVIKNGIPLWVRAIATVFTPMNPLWALRAAGPFGQWVVEKTRPDITKKYSPLIEDDQLIAHYIHQCNVQTPTGESAFHSMMSGFGWAKNPMIKRIHDVRQDIPITLLYGSRSWVDNSAGELIKQSGHHSYVNVQIISGAGHHVYADKPDIFNRYVNDACTLSDTVKKVVAVRTISNSSKSKNENTESDQDEQEDVILNSAEIQQVQCDNDNKTKSS